MIDLQEIRMKNTSDLKLLLEDLLEEQFKLKMQAATGQLAKSTEFKKVRKNIARIKTIMKEKQNNDYESRKNIQKIHRHWQGCQYFYG